MIHQNQDDTKHDTIMSKPDILAFHKPDAEISPRGFGFLDYANINDVVKRGFVIADTLCIKVEINIV